MKILDIELYTTDLDSTRFFYVRRLGLPILSRSASHLTVLVGWTRLTFRLVDQPVAPYHFAINVPRGSLDVIMYYFDLEYIATQAPGKTIADFPSWRARACYFYDSVGNLLEFIARTDLYLDDPNLTFSDLFQGVSEIGIATEDVAHTTRQIQGSFAIQQFDKTAPTSDFNALGDDNGLFILSRVGRNWLFSDTPAGLNYCRVEFSNGSDVQVMYSYEVNRLPKGKGAFAPLIFPSIS
jgi:catechol 2,3-dioxygenase-like lactoylglutathione lyase family enzyme